MEVIVIEKESYKQLLAQLSTMVKTAAKEAVMETIHVVDPVNDWISAEDAQRLLGVKSKNKLILLRDSGEIECTMHGRIYRYSKKSIQKFLERNKVQ